LVNRLPPGVPSEAVEIARDTLGAAVSVAEQLPEQLGLMLLGIAKTSFIQGLHLTASISSTIAIGAAIMILILLRRVPARAELEGQQAAVAFDTTLTELDELEV
jgi:DHA2 family multidrug resistance protein-like MFS transporter